MGREIKRVPLDFDWPLDKTWHGFFLPDRLRGIPCPDCEGGQTHFAWWMQAMSYLMGMLAQDVREQERGKPMHPWLAEFPNHHGHWEYLIGGVWGKHRDAEPEERRATQGRFVVDRPSKDALTFFARLTDRPEAEIGGGIFSSQDENYAVMRKLYELTGVSTECPTCEGRGDSEAYPGQRAEAEVWETFEPPEGDGYQLWETVSEGSPITPVFADAEGLARYMTTHGWGASKPMASSFEVAMQFIDAGWAPSAVASSGHGVESGVEFVGRTSGVDPE